MTDICRVCNRSLDTRQGVCFDCADFEAMIDEKKDMYDKPIIKEIPGSKSLNILHMILKFYGVKK